MIGAMNRGMTTVHEESGEQLDNTGGSGNVLERDSGGSSGNLLDVDGRPTSQTKRYRVFIELLDTEQNYVQVLEMILNTFKTPLDEYEQTEGVPLFSKRDQHVLFSKVHSLLQIHSHIRDSLQALHMRWSEKALIGQVYATVKEQLLKNYVPYINSYDNVIETINELKRDPKVYQWLQECESNCEGGKRYKFTDLMIRPVQRLPSVILLLRELLKVTKSGNPDVAWLRCALETLDYVLSQSNERRQQSDQHSRILDVANNIDDFPDVLVTFKRSVYGHVDLYLIKAQGSFKQYNGSELTFFLFNDVVAVTKKRSCTREPNAKSQRMLGNGIGHNSFRRSSVALTRSVSTTSFVGRASDTLQRSLSIRSLAKRERKPYKFADALRFQTFRLLMFVEDRHIFYIKMRDDMGEQLCAYQVTGETTMDEAKKFFATLCDLINSTTTTKRNVELLDVTSALGRPFVDNPDYDAEDLAFMCKTSNAVARAREPHKLVRIVSGLF